MSLKREIGLFGATMMGLGSIIGTGVFVSLGIAAGIAGAGVIVAIIAAAGVATCNALSSAQLAANHPVSGGTYEYGYRYLRPWLGFSAGWMFLCAKTASAATAALGFAGYLLNATGQDPRWLAALAACTVAVLTAIVLAGIRLSSHFNIAIVSMTLVALAAFVVGGAPAVSANHLQFTLEPLALLHATALMFVAYTGYGRIATLGEEVREPRGTIPRAIIITLIVSALVYVSVAIVGVGAAGGETLAKAAIDKAAPLEVVSRHFPLRVHWIVAIGAITAMLGVLLNLVLGLSRVLLAMGRRGDMPAATANASVAVVVTGVAIAALAAIGSIKTNWSFSAFTVLVYYAITNLAALGLTGPERLYPRWIAWIGLVACLSLAFAVEWQVWLIGLALIAGGLAWHAVSKKLVKRVQQTATGSE
ncbi:MAG TPA: APC family permease [Lacipirellulaceae bacterium]|nr:APC family permease [Lacipirellulaceae bacterium]